MQIYQPILNGEGKYYVNNKYYELKKEKTFDHLGKLNHF